MKILIAGDSWAMGEWNPVWQGWENQILHKGLEQYLLDDNCEVTNISGAGDSLKTTFENLQKISETYDFIFVFTSNPHGAIEDDKFWIPNYTYTDYFERHKEALRYFVQCLYTLNIGPIKLLGGSAKCLAEYVAGTDIEIAIPSIIELLIPDIKQYDMSFEYHLKYINKTVPPQIVDKVYEQAQIFDNIFATPIMHPDGQHPNREGHYKIYQVLKDKYFYVKTN